MRTLLFSIAFLSSLMSWALTVSFEVVHDACGTNTGIITAGVSDGVPPYTYQWSPNPPFGQGTAAISFLPAGNWAVTVTDSNGDTVTGSVTVDDLDGPELLDMSLTHACVGGIPGAVTFIFDQISAVALSTNGMIETWAVDNISILELPGLSPGLYTLSVSIGSLIGLGIPPDPFTCNIEIDFTILEIQCGTVNGVVYVDLDEDCDYNLADIPYSGQVISFQPGDIHVLTNSAGEFELLLPYGAYSVSAGNVLYDLSCPAGPDILLSPSNPVIDLGNLPVITSSGPDLTTHIAAGAARIGSVLNYHISVFDPAHHTHGPTLLVFDYDPVLIFDSSSMAPSVNTPGHLEFELAGIGLWETIGIVVSVEVPVVVGLIGQFTTATATVTPSPADTDPTNDSYSIHRMIIGAYDPNDKLARTSSDQSAEHYFIDQDEYIDYTIRFQNTGNAEAYHVFLIDTISPDLDLGSLHVIAASHTYEVQLLPERVLRFDFPDIMLPDSASDESGSQGFASFRLRPHNGVMVGDVLENFADIYFDFNPPIRTNTSQLLVEISTSITTSIPRGRTIAWPNPVADELNIRMENGTDIEGWRMFDVMGRTVAGMERGSLSEMITIPCADLPSGSYVVVVFSGSERSFIQVVKGR